MSEGNLQQRWHAYYTEKRIVHQWTQVHLLRDLPVHRILEVGPHIGLVTAMLASAGYTVTTLDVRPDPPPVGASRHIAADIRALDAAAIGGFDAILCCETLEHIAWDRVDAVLRAFAASGAPWLILSVPYEGFQFAAAFYVNRHTFRKRSSLRKFRFLRRFHIADAASFDAHKWEVGYRGYGLRAFIDKIAACGWQLREKHFTAECRSVFLVCGNAAATTGK
jgi:hypothetical protein